jgi:hypothetical protein
VLFYNIRPSAGPATPLSGARVEEDLPTQAVDDALLGQIDGVEGGEISGWACKRGYMGAPLQARRPGRRALGSRLEGQRERGGAVAGFVSRCWALRGIHTCVW